MPADPTIPQPTSRTPRSSQPPPRWFPWTSILLVTGVFFGVYACWEAPREIGRWQMAAAREHWREAQYGIIQGDQSQVAENRQQALAKVEDALRWSPDDPTMLLQRAQWNIEAGNYEAALDDCNRLMEKFENEVELLTLRGQIYHLLGRHAEAVADAEHINNLSQTSGNPPRAAALNYVAYAKAIGKLELDSALKQINEALQLKRNSAACLDTRGFIYYQMGKYHRALKDLDLASNQIEEQLRDQQEKSAKERRQSPDVRIYEIGIREQNEMIAPVFYHRALIHEKLGNTAAAAADRKRVRELIGRDGDEKLF